MAISSASSNASSSSVTGQGKLMVPPPESSRANGPTQVRTRRGCDRPNESIVTIEWRRAQHLEQVEMRLLVPPFPTEEMRFFAAEHELGSFGARPFGLVQILRRRPLRSGGRK